MATDRPRIKREARTLTAMVGIYCRGHHGTVKSRLCTSCTTLLDYALQRLKRCPYQAAKPTCARCPIHCYRPAEREQIRAVMRYAGPRILWHHPGLAVAHLLDGLKKPPNADKVKPQPPR